MRADPNEKEFSKWLLDLGDGKLPVFHEEDMIQIPDKCICKDDIVAEIYGNRTSNEMQDVCILCPLNAQVSDLNLNIQDQIIQGNEVSYTSIDEIETDDPSEKTTSLLNS
jgi:hypothetical protein